MKIWRLHRRGGISTTAVSNEDYLEAERPVYRSNKQSEDLDQCWASDCDQAKSPSSGAIYDCDGVVCARTGTRSVYGFLASQTYTNFLAAYKWYPAPPAFKSSADVRREKSLWEYAKRDQSSLEALQYLAHHIWNIIEDGYIESRMLNQFPGTLGQSLEFLRTQFLRISQRSRSLSKQRRMKNSLLISLRALCRSCSVM